MIFYLIPLLFIDICLFFAAFRSFILSSLEKSIFYRILGMLAVGLYAFITCEVLLDIIEYYYSVGFIRSLSINPIFALMVSGLIMCFVYKDGTKWVEGYLINLEKQK